ncbi:SPOR domain-containing protein [Sphingomonas psychrotolerans]|uniref:SPOR domain-containing protein n=1 Tax=Sphingomonas psychrotolerans TaxID=1327635 RepID=A0A2K8MJJ6_9SPHN|nr:SPOR domain-containing protein [Sphingomonas psychrotolerans]ATY31909.1 SPOR domain-containing protein [Sphingomonas psychrotolerans]
MKQIRSLRSIALAFALAAGAAPALAQTGLVPAPNPEADRLAQEMRVLAADPRDVRALLEAGNLSARLGDTAAALAFFARAETIDPTNPRILAGRGSTLVRMERPGEALRLFQTAEARGLPAREYAGDRGFAYDLLGQPILAQGDYKLALQGERDDEMVRRYALSLGISGNVEESMRQLDPLLRKSDRAAWRARAFILAMNGDMPGAERIAASMMPGNMGHSLAPFFRRLANLAPADRAFAVHFGQLTPAAARLADARQAPPLPQFVAPTRPAQVAQVQPQPARASPEKPQRDRRSRRERERDAREVAPPARRVVQALTPPVQTAAAASLPGPPVVAREQAPLVQPLPKPRAEEIDAPIRQAAAPVEAARSAITGPGQGSPAATSVGDTARAEPVTAAPAPTTDVAATPERQPAETLPEAARPAPDAASSGPAAVAASKPEPAPPGPARVGQEDTVLASIVAGITIPGEELQIVNATPVDPVPEPVRVAAAVPEPVRPTPTPAAKPAAKPKPETVKPEPVKGKDTKKPEPAKPDPKAKKPDPKAKPPAKADPARIWVQVAGGANAASLPKAWKAVTARAPAAFKGKSGWWTPLRATNRVLAGPFKTAAEAQAFVNALRKSDVSGFVFTSETGQKVTKLAD